MVLHRQHRSNRRSHWDYFARNAQARGVGGDTVGGVDGDRNSVGRNRSFCDIDDSEDLIGKFSCLKSACLYASIDLSFEERYAGYFIRRA